MALRADDVDLGRDRDLVERYQAGDPQAFDDLYRRYFDRLHRFCRRHARDSHEAEEIAQEAFVKAFRSMDTLQGERRFYPWMTVIAKRISIDRHRKLGRLELTEEPDLGSVDPELDHLFDAVDIAHLRSALDRLGPRHREVLHLREEQGMSYADIATQLDVPVTTVEALLHRARKALRREYAAVGGEARGALGLPVIGWLAARAWRFRSLLSEKWAEAAAIAAPVAVGAVTAAVVLAPSPSPVPGPGAASVSSRPSAPVVSTYQGAVHGPGDLVFELPAAAAPGALPSSDATPTAPSASAGPVDVFVGPDGTDQARENAEQMPVGASTAPADAGFDPPVTADDATQFVDRAVSSALDPASTDQRLIRPRHAPRRFPLMRRRLVLLLASIALASGTFGAVSAHAQTQRPGPHRRHHRRRLLGVRGPQLGRCGHLPAQPAARPLRWSRRSAR